MEMSLKDFQAKLARPRLPLTPSPSPRRTGARGDCLIARFLELMIYSPPFSGYTRTLVSMKFDLDFERLLIDNADHIFPVQNAL